MTISKFKKGMRLVICFALALTLSGCGNPANTDAQSRPKLTFPPAATSNDDYTTYDTGEYQITLPRDYKKRVTDDGTITFYNGYAIVVPRNEPFTLHPALPDMTLEAYGQQMIKVIGVDTTLKKYGRVLWFEYEVDVPEKNQTLTHLVTLYKSNSAFWYIEYICDSREIESHRNYYLEWAQSVKFAN